MSTTRATVISDIDTFLKAIDGSGGYSINLNNRVYHWREKPLAASSCPAVIFRDLDDFPDESLDSGGLIHNLKIETALYYDMNGNSMSGLYDAMQDVLTAMKRLLSSDASAAIVGIMYDYSEFDLEHREDKIVRVAMEFTIMYASNYFEM